MITVTEVVDTRDGESRNTWIFSRSGPECRILVLKEVGNPCPLLNEALRNHPEFMYAAEYIGLRGNPPDPVRTRNPDFETKTRNTLDLPVPLIKRNQPAGAGGSQPFAGA